MRLTEQRNISRRSFNARFLSFNAHCIFNFFFRETEIKEEIFFLSILEWRIWKQFSPMSRILWQWKSRNRQPRRQRMDVDWHFLTEILLMWYVDTWQREISYSSTRCSTKDSDSSSSLRFVKERNSTKRRIFMSRCFFIDKLKVRIIIISAFKIIFKHLNRQISSQRIATISPEKYTILL